METNLREELKRIFAEAMEDKYVQKYGLDGVEASTEKYISKLETLINEQYVRKDDQDYIKWVEDKLLLKTDGIETTMVRPVLYQVWSNVKALVANDLHKRHADERWYHEYKKDIYRFVGDTVSNAMYMLDKVGALRAQNDYLKTNTDNGGNDLEESK